MSSTGISAEEERALRIIAESLAGSGNNVEAFVRGFLAGVQYSRDQIEDFLADIEHSDN